MFLVARDETEEVSDLKNNISEYWASSGAVRLTSSAFNSSSVRVSMIGPRTIFSPVFFCTPLVEVSLVEVSLVEVSLVEVEWVYEDF